MRLTVTTSEPKSSNPVCTDDGGDGKGNAPLTWMPRGVHVDRSKAQEEAGKRLLPIDQLEPRMTMLLDAIPNRVWIANGVSGKQGVVEVR